MHKEDSPQRQTAEQRHQDEVTNRSGLDDVATEGNLLEVAFDQGGLTLVLGNRDGRVTVRYACGMSCPTLKPGDYVQVEGTKVNEYLYEADSVTVTN